MDVELIGRAPTSQKRAKLPGKDVWPKDARRARPQLVRRPARASAQPWTHRPCGGSAAADGWGLILNAWTMLSNIDVEGWSSWNCNVLM